ncbi:hypothetical protein [Hymenobacter cellulosilyticus]|uniref:Uncharacterized protein n=1 Tax=Hymenobacter cellulosilyticus TaxID=2932248 RepID=A0A8T9Q313_9BACT|nr:hypothetical protein [Hymenobacter cellulosilyticus]UOQ72116.1 hypothetical protein MUN79_26710 [Hymenobacter cellulosilyticus]
MEPNPIIPAGVFARIEHQGQPLTVVKIQEAYQGDVSQLQRELSTALELAPGAALLVLPIEGPRCLVRARPSSSTTTFSRPIPRPWPSRPGSPSGAKSTARLVSICGITRARLL